MEGNKKPPLPSTKDSKKGNKKRPVPVAMSTPQKDLVRHGTAKSGGGEGRGTQHSVPRVVNIPHPSHANHHHHQLGPPGGMPMYPGDGPQYIPPWAQYMWLPPYYQMPLGPVPHHCPPYK